MKLFRVFFAGLAGVCLCALSYAGHYELKPLAKNPHGGFFTTEHGSVAYSNGVNGYGGASSNYEGVAECYGKITTVYVWVPNKLPGTSIDDPTDVPPEEVIVEEKCTVSATAFTGSVGFGLVDCDNDLGFESEYGVITWPRPPAVTGDGFGIRYRKVQGGSEITLECEPMAYADSADSFTLASVWYSSRVIVPTVNYKGVTHSVSSVTSEWGRRFITGQQVEATISLVSGAGTGQQPILRQERAPYWFDLLCSLAPEVFEPYREAVLFVQSSGGSDLQVLSGTLEWKIVGGNPFKNFKTAPTDGGRVELTANDMNANALKFYTVNSTAGNADDDDDEEAYEEEVEVSCEFKLALPEGARFEFDGDPPGDGLMKVKATGKLLHSVRPKLERWDILPGDIHKLSSGFQFGDSTDPGQYWEVDMSVPHFGEVGTGCFAQLIKANRVIKRNLPPFAPPGLSDKYVKSPYNNVEVIDTQFPYTPVGPLPNWDVQWGIASTGKSGDSPFQPYECPPLDNGGNDWYESLAQDTFKTWVMYRPPSKDQMATTWVPIAKYEWSWGAKAERISPGNWGLSGKNSNTGTHAGSTEHPSWPDKSDGLFGFAPG